MARTRGRAGSRVKDRARAIPRARPRLRAMVIVRADLGI